MIFMSSGSTPTLPLWGHPHVLPSLPVIKDQLRKRVHAKVNWGKGLELGRRSEALDLAQPARQWVPTRENLGHHIPPIFHSEILDLREILGANLSRSKTPD